MFAAVKKNETDIFLLPIIKQTGHKTVTMVHRYVREDQADRQSAESKLGLRPRDRWTGTAA